MTTSTITKAMAPFMANLQVRDMTKARTTATTHTASRVFKKTLRSQMIEDLYDAVLEVFGTRVFLMDIHTLEESALRATATTMINNVEVSITCKPANRTAALLARLGLAHRRTVTDLAGELVAREVTCTANGETFTRVKALAV